MDFIIVSIAAIVVLGILVALGSVGQKDDGPVTVGHDCSSCASLDDGSCKIACLMEEKKRREDNKSSEDAV